MKHIKNYQDFKVNEGVIGSLINMAKGAFKSFLNVLSAPFKSLKDDLKKGLPKEELKKKITLMLDNLLKGTTDSLNKAEDENAINQIMDTFKKEFDEKCAEIDKEIKMLKESNMIFESAALKDSMIAGRVLLGLVRQKAAEIKMEFDKKYAASKDLAGKKAARISEIKTIVDDFKKKVTDDKYIDEQIKKYKEENKIQSETGILVLDWGDVDVTIKLPKKGVESKYKILKSNSKKLVIPQGKELYCNISGEAKKGEKVKLEKITIGPKDTDAPFKIGTDDFYETGSLTEITLDGKIVDSYKFGEGEVDGQTEVQQNLVKIKSQKPDRINDIKKFTEFTLDAEDGQMKTMMDLVDGEMKK